METPPPDEPATPPIGPAAARVVEPSWLTRHRADLVWLLIVAVLYVACTAAVAANTHSAGNRDRAMRVALQIASGRLDSGLKPGTLDTATEPGGTFLVISPLPIVPYLLFVPIEAAWGASRWIVSCVLGVAAAWLMLPLARRYGPGGSTTRWLAVLGAFGTLLWTQSISGNFYYLAHVEAMLFTLGALIEWGGRRRPWVIALGIGLAGLARPTVLLAAIPLGIGLLMGARDRWRTAVAFGIPVLAVVGVTAFYNAARFGSPLETGYGISTLSNKTLIEARAKGVFSLRHVADNLHTLFVQGFSFRGHPLPHPVPSSYGHSILLTTPALLIALWTGIRSRTAVVLWSSAFLIAIPLLLYYGGGGFWTYGYRYALDVTPFLLALVAMGARRHFGAIEKVLIVLSVVFVGYGALWAITH
ncbi:MAG: hypothetical protein ABJC39_01585 [Chloroflexota bacterium]